MDCFSTYLRIQIQSAVAAALCRRTAKGKSKKIVHKVSPMQTLCRKKAALLLNYFEAPQLQFCSAMKHNKTQFNIFARFVDVLLISLLPLAPLLAGNTNQKELQTRQVVTLEQEKQLIADFNRHVKDYLKQRERVRAKLPTLSKNATPEQIDTYQKAFAEALRAMRAGTKQGYIFNPALADYLRTRLKTEFAPSEKAEIRKPILEADTKGVPLKVNYPYPETKELTQIPPTLLLKLPQLPKELKYRYVGRHMLLVDTDNSLIVDYMLDALP